MCWLEGAVSGPGGTGGGWRGWRSWQPAGQSSLAGQVRGSGQVTWRGGTSAAAQGPSPGEAQAAGVSCLQGGGGTGRAGGSAVAGQHPLRGRQSVQVGQGASGLQDWLVAQPGHVVVPLTAGWTGEASSEPAAAFRQAPALDADGGRPRSLVPLDEFFRRSIALTIKDQWLLTGFLRALFWTFSFVCSSLA